MTARDNLPAYPEPVAVAIDTPYSAEVHDVVYAALMAAGVQHAQLRGHYTDAVLSALGEARWVLLPGPIQTEWAVRNPRARLTGPGLGIAPMPSQPAMDAFLAANQPVGGPLEGIRRYSTGWHVVATIGGPSDGGGKSTQDGAQ